MTQPQRDPCLKPKSHLTHRVAKQVSSNWPDTKGKPLELDQNENRESPKTIIVGDRSFYPVFECRYPRHIQGGKSLDRKRLIFKNGVGTFSIPDEAYTVFSLDNSISPFLQTWSLGYNNAPFKIYIHLTHMRSYACFVIDLVIFDLKMISRFTNAKWQHTRVENFAPEIL